MIKYQVAQLESGEVLRISLYEKTNKQEKKKLSHAQRV